MPLFWVKYFYLCHWNWSLKRQLVLQGALKWSFVGQVKVRAWSLSEYKEGFFCLNILEKVKVTFEKATGSVRCPEMVLCRTGQGESLAIIWIQKDIFCLNILGTDLICGVRCQDNDYPLGWGSDWHKGSMKEGRKDNIWVLIVIDSLIWVLVIICAGETSSYWMLVICTLPCM